MAFRINASESSSSEETVNNAVIDITSMEGMLPPPPPAFHMLGGAAEPSSDISADGVEGFSGGYEGVNFGAPVSLQPQDGGWAPLWQMVGGQLVVNDAHVGPLTTVSDSALLLGSHDHYQAYHSQSDGC